MTGWGIRDGRRWAIQRRLDGCHSLGIHRGRPMSTSRDGAAI